MPKQYVQYGNPANYNATPGTRVDGQESALEVDNVGGLINNPKPLESKIDSVAAHLAPWDNKAAITANSAVMSEPGVFGGFVLNSFTPGAVIKVYDHASATSGTVLATYTLTAAHLSGNTYGPGEAGILCANGAYYEISVAAANITPLVRQN